MPFQTMKQLTQEKSNDALMPIPHGLDFAKPGGFRKNTLDSRLPVLLYFRHIDC